MNELCVNMSRTEFVDGLSGCGLDDVNSDFIAFSQGCKGEAVRGRIRTLTGTG